MQTKIRLVLAILFFIASSGRLVAQGELQQPTSPQQQTADTGASQQPKAVGSEDQKPNNTNEQDKDLALIPTGANDGTAAGSRQPTAAAAANQRIYLEDAFIPSVERSGLLVPSPQAGAAAWQERLFLDARKVWGLREDLSFTVSDRFNFRAENDISFPNHENVFNEFREGYFSWKPSNRWYLDAGRINLKNGAALGFNPTDFFKTRAVVEALSADPSVLREDRLGTFALEGQYLGSGYSLTVAASPALVGPGAIPAETALPTFDPGLDRTNSQTRILVKGSVNIGSDFNPELIYFRDGNQDKFGFNLTRSLGQKIVVYGEWAGGKRTDLVDSALHYGERTGSLPIGTLTAIPDNSNYSFQSDLALGGSYTTANKITYNLEYHYHQAGFSSQQWKDWFSSGTGQSSTSPIVQELWYIRNYASDQQEPIMKHSAFLRADWVDAFITDLEITGFVNTDLRDGSSLVQMEADYYVSNKWTVGAQAQGSFGRKRSDFGSLPEAASFFVKVARYF
jgi:hypothetical protein